MLNLIQAKLGPRISQLVSEQFIVDRVRKDTDRQYIPLRAQIGVSHRGLIRVAQLMEENIEKPLSLEQIAKSTGLSRRQIERLFKRDLNCVPKHYYLEMRLRRARELLLQTAMPIMDITTACGFQSPPHFSKCYRMQFGYPPSAARKIGDQRGQRRSANGASPVATLTPARTRADLRSCIPIKTQPPGDVLGALFRNGLLAEAVIEAHAKDSRLIRRLAQIEVAGVAVHNRVLVGEVGDIELGEPVAPVRVQPKAQAMSAARAARI